jgi:hypothetical protein
MALISETMESSNTTTFILNQTDSDDTEQLDTINRKLLELENQINHLQEILLNPPYLTITGIKHLSMESGHDWKDKIYNLFYNARIPMFWILDINEVDLETNHPNTVTVTFINLIVKEHVTTILTAYLQHDYQNNIYIY